VLITLGGGALPGEKNRGHRGPSTHGDEQKERVAAGRTKDFTKMPEVHVKEGANDLDHGGRALRELGREP